MKRLITILILVAVAAGGVFAYQRYRRQQQAQALSSLETVPAGFGDLTATVGATGVVRANQTTQLVWGTSGRVETVDVNVGDQVSSGQVLAKLAKSSLAQNIILAEAELISAQKALEDLTTQAEAAKVAAMQNIVTYEQAAKDAQYDLDNYNVPTNQVDLDTVEAVNIMKARLDEARNAFEPYKYYSLDNPTRKELKTALDEAQADYNSAVKRLGYEYNLEVAQANLNQALREYEKWKDGPTQADLKAAETKVTAAQASLNLARLDAPFAGTVTTVQVKPGDEISPGAAAFRVDDLSHLLVDVQVSEVDINRVRLGQDVALTFDAIPGKEYHGKVTDVAKVGENIQGVVEFVATVELTDADEEIRPGMTAAVNIVVDQLKEVLLVPNRAVRVEEGDRVVYVMRNNRPEPARITLGASSETFSQVVDGELKEGDAIVLNPPVNFENSGGPGFMR